MFQKSAFKLLSFRACSVILFQEDPNVVCSALGLCVSQQEALAKAQLMSNEIPKVDLSQRVNPLLLNIPQLLYPMENGNKKTETTPEVSPLPVCRGRFVSYGLLQLICACVCFSAGE